MTKDTAKRLFFYDRWANLRVLHTLGLANDVSPQDRAARLFSHILRSQSTWLQRVKGHVPSTQDFWPVLAVDTWSDLLHTNHTAWIRLLDALSTDLTVSYTYHNSKGVLYETSLYDIIQHLIIHGQHHRAQISLLLRENGETPPATDFIYFTRDATADHGPA